MIRDYLTEDLVLCDKEVNDWREAARVAGKLLQDKDKVNDAFIASMIETVEKFGPYMILVPKVCFFHGQPGENVKEPCLSLVVFREAITFSDFDDQDISCCFAFGATDAQSHMEMIRSVAQILQDEDFIQAITGNEPKEKIMAMIQNY